MTHYGETAADNNGGGLGNLTAKEDPVSDWRLKGVLARPGGDAWCSGTAGCGLRGESTESLSK